MATPPTPWVESAGAAVVAAPAVAALQYAARGWPVIPCDRAKRPRTAHGLKDATTDEAVIRGWWRLWPDADVAIRTGQVVVVDVDGDEGADSLHQLEERHDSLPTTATALTGGGGAHYYFAASRRISNSAGRLGPGLDVRGVGGYVVAPPSRHQSGRRYEWDSPPNEVEPAVMPGWLERLVVDDRHAPGSARPVSEWRRVVAGVEEGRRNETTARLCGHLLARGVDPYVTVELLVAWDAQNNRPPLGRDEVTRSCESIARRELAKGTRRVRD